MPIIKLNNRSIKDVTSLPFGVGNLIHIQSQTASNSASISFTTGIDSTFKEYQFYFIDIHPRTNNVRFKFNMSTDGGSNYNATKTTTMFIADHFEDDSIYEFSYDGGSDLAQSTSDQTLNAAGGFANDADASLAGSLLLFNPASTTYVKHFIANVEYYGDSDITISNYCAGYANTTSAVNAIIFRMDSGNMDGTIAMFGVV